MIRTGSPLRPGFTLVILAALFSLPASLLQALPLPENSRALLDKQRQLAFSVSRAAGSGYIALVADYETAVSADRQTIVSILRDYENIPKVFSRIGTVRVLERQPALTFTEQHSGVKVLGIEFYTTLRFTNRDSEEDSTTTRLTFEQTVPSENLVNCHGYWLLIDGSEPGHPLCYLRYRLEFDVLAQYPGQETIMRNLGAGDVERSIRELSLFATRLQARD